MANETSNASETAGKSKSNPGKGAPGTGVQWVDDDRSLPMYRTRECDNAVIEGYLGDVAILGPDGADEHGNSRKFGALVIKLTADCPCFVNEEKTTIKAGKEIYVPLAADLRDLITVALSRDLVYQYRMTPTGKKIKTAAGFSMLTWKRQRNPEGVKRETVFPGRPAALLLQPAGVTKLLTEGATVEQTEFEPKDLE